MAKIEFPKFLYHATEQPKVVNSQGEMDELGDGWAESPVESVQPEASPDLEAMNKPQLLEFAKSRGIDVDPREKKEAVLAAIKERLQ